MRTPRGSVVALGFVIFATVALYASPVAGMVRQWFDDTTSSHGILLVGAAVFLLRRTWPTLPPITHPRNSGLAVIAFALLIYVLGSLTGDVFVLRASLPLLLAGLVLGLLGAEHHLKLFEPLALLAMAVPLPAVLVTDLTLPLQLIASRVAAVTLAASGIHVVRDGNLLTLPNITLEVAEACNGLRSVVSLVAVAAVCAAVIPLNWWRSAITIAAAVPIAVVGNGLRVAATGVLATWFGEAAVKGSIHELTGVVAFLTMCAATFAMLAMTRSGSLRWLRQHQ
jgi:exosortase